MRKEIIMRKCRLCGHVYKPKTHRLKRSDYRCEDCCRAYHRAYLRKWRQKRREMGIIEHHSGSRKWNPKKYKAWCKKYYSNPRVRERRAAQMRKYRMDPEKRARHLARWTANHAKNAGRLKPQPCAVCEKTKTQMHHKDYNQPLLIVWLCGKCHKNIARPHALAEKGAWL